MPLNKENITKMPENTKKYPQIKVKVKVRTNLK